MKTCVKTFSKTAKIPPTPTITPLNGLKSSTPLKVAIYCRLSEEDRNKLNRTDDSCSIQNQKTMLIQYAYEHGWYIFGIYSDDDYAGADRRRPEFNRLLQDAEAHRFDIILCKTQSRFTRELELVEKYIHGLFPLWGIRFISIVDNADTSNAGNKKSRQINGLVNEWYLEDMSDNIRSVLKNRRENGFHIGSFALYGYMKDPNQKGHLLIDEEAATIVREVFTLFSKGYGKSTIARILNDRGVPNPTEYKRLKGLRYKQPPSKNSTLWKYFAISNMLTNEMYIGNMVQGKYGSVSYKTKENKPRPKSQWYIVEGTHEPIIEPDLWETVQNIIKQRTRPFKSGTIGIFAGKVRCANCGYVMRSTKNRGKNYLQCPNRHISKDACIGAFISVDSLEHRIIEELKNLSAKFLDTELLEHSIKKCQDPDAHAETLHKNITTYENKITTISRALRELYMDKVKGIISEIDYIEMTKDFTKERERLKNLISNTKEQLSNINYDPAELINSYINPNHLTREIIELLIDHVSVGKRIPGTRNVPIEIHWNF